MTQPMPEPGIPEDPRPDLVLGVWRERRDGELVLSYQLRETATATHSFEQKLDNDPFEIFKELFEHVESVGAGKELDKDAQLKAERQIEGVGATLAERVLPEALRNRLLEHHDPSRDPEDDAPSLWVVSDEPWVPWELLRLRRPGTGEGPFLGEAFALTRWLWDLEPTLALPLDRIGLVVPQSSELEEAAQERLNVLALEKPGEREVESLEARYNRLLDGFASNRFSGWHFTGHGGAEDGGPDLWSVLLDDGELQPTDLRAREADLSGRRPLVFLNACRSARMHLALSGLGGLAEAFLEAGAGTFVGTHWSVVDDRARAFAQAFYEFFLEGDSIGEALRQTRLWLRNEFQGDPTWLAYTAFAHPRAALRAEAGTLPAPRWPGRYLEIPWKEWSAELSPGALLRADHGVVPFHKREAEIAELREWCVHERKVRVRLFTGPGGMGKTRLALQLCQEMRDQGWRSGFVKREADARPEAVARSLARDGGPLLLVVDYAETRRGLLVPLFQELLESEDQGPVRIVLLSRWREEWWEQLKVAPGRVGDLVSGPATSHAALGPLAMKKQDRAQTYQEAAKAFAGKLSRPVPEGLPEDLEAEYFKPVLMLHMSALGAVEEVELKGEDGILDWVLNRERKFWRNQAEAKKLETSLERGIGRAMTAITLAGGSPSQNAAVSLLETLKSFSGFRRPDLAEISYILHATYPGEHWINPLQPDILGEHLVEREFEGDEEGAEEIFSLVLGPRKEPAAADITNA